MEFNLNKLKGKIIEVCGTQDAFAKEMGKDRSTINLKMNGKRDFTQSEINKACEILSIPDNEVSQYFFTPKF